MKMRKITAALLLCLTLSICAFATIQPTNAKATKTTFVSTFAWAPGASTPNDFEAGQTIHRRNRITIFNITETDNSLLNGNMTRIVNFNRNYNKERTQRWGTFEIVLEGVLLWKGTWIGRAAEGTTTENYVGHGVGALDGMQIRFTLKSPGGFVTGFILNTHE